MAKNISSQTRKIEPSGRENDSAGKRIEPVGRRTQLLKFRKFGQNGSQKIDQLLLAAQMSDFFMSQCQPDKK